MIEEELKGTEAALRCGTLNGNRASCRADWKDSTGAYCTGEFKLHVHGQYVDIADGLPIICSTV